MYITIFASGSSGNCALVSAGGTHILVDAGISAKRISAGLQALGVAPHQLAAVLLTHEHSDHISGLRVLSKKAGAPIYATGPTCQWLYNRNRCNEIADLMRATEAGTGVQIGSLWVESFPTPHDAAGSVGYSVAGDGGRMVLCTDLGHVTDEVRRAVKDCGLLVCEANHDEERVRSGPYPYYLKQRILGEYGHLSNEAGAELAALAVESGAKTVVLAHLSQQNNSPGLARRAAERALSQFPEVNIQVAPVLCQGLRLEV